METKMEKGFPAPLFRDPIFDGIRPNGDLEQKGSVLLYVLYPEAFYIGAGWIFINPWK